MSTFVFDFRKCGGNIRKRYEHCLVSFRFIFRILLILPWISKNLKAKLFIYALNIVVIRTQCESVDTYMLPTSRERLKASSII